MTVHVSACQCTSVHDSRQTEGLEIGMKKPSDAYKWIMLAITAQQLSGENESVDVNILQN